MYMYRGLIFKSNSNHSVHNAGEKSGLTFLQYECIACEVDIKNNKLDDPCFKPYKG